MKSNRIRHESGRRAASRGALALFAALLLLVPGCNYGFEGGGFPAHIGTIYIAPFENQTPQFELQGQLFDSLIEALPGQLGLRTAGEESADAILRGSIVRYDDVARNYRDDADNPAGNVLTHEVQIGIAAELVDVRDNVIRWESRSLTGRGTYNPSNQTEEVGQREAIENLIEQIIDGAQSQW